MANDPVHPAAALRYNDRTAPELATDAEEALLGIVHLTELEEAPLGPTELYRTLSALTRLVEQLPEAVARVSSQLSSWSGDEALVVLSGPFHGNPDAAIAAMQQAVTDRVLPAISHLVTGLSEAQAAVNQLARED